MTFVCIFRRCGQKTELKYSCTSIQQHINTATDSTAPPVWSDSYTNDSFELVIFSESKTYETSVVRFPNESCEYVFLVY